MTTANRVEQALKDANLRKFVGSIDDNYGVPGQVVIYVDGVGIPVRTIKEALKAVTTRR